MKVAMFWEWISWQTSISFKGLDHMVYFTYLIKSDLRTKEITPFKSLEEEIRKIMAEHGEENG